MSDVNPNVQRATRSVPPKVVHVVGGAIGLALGAAFVMMVLMPVQARQARAQSDGNKLAEARASLADKDRKIVAGRAELAGLRQQLDSSVQLQSSENVNRVVQNVTDAAIKAGLSVAEVTPGDKERESREYAIVPIQLTATGTFAQTLNFLHASNGEFRDIATRGIHVRRRDGAAGVDVKLDLAWYTLPGREAGSNGRSDRAGAAR